MNHLKPEMDRIIKLAANYSLLHDINNKDTLAKLTVIIIEETLKVVGNNIIKTTYDMDIYGDQKPLNSSVDFNKRERKEEID